MISDRIRGLRESTGMSAKKFAETIGIKYTTYYGYETGAREPGSDFIVKFADYFGITTDYILGIDTKKSPEPVVIDSEEVQECEKWLTDLLVSKGYIKPGEDISDRDADFLIHWIGLLDAWIAGNG